MFLHFCIFMFFIHNALCADKNIGFPEGIRKESTNEKANITGKLPKWFKGYYVRQLCGAFGSTDLSSVTVSHFFDCLGMVGSYRICPQNNVQYSNKYYATKATAIWKENDKNLTKSKISWNTLFTQIDVGKYSTDSRLNKYENILDYNPNMDFWTIDNSLQANSQTSPLMQLNVHNLDTIGNYQFDDDNMGLTTQDIVVNALASQIVDSRGTTWATTMILHDNHDNTWESFRIIYSITKESPTIRNVLTKFPLNTIKLDSCQTNLNGYLYYSQRNYQNFMGYLHTMAVTDSYIVLPVSNYVINPCYSHPDARKDPSPLLGTWFYTDSRRSPLTLLIFHKSNGKLFKSISIPSSSSKDFISHIFNSYEVEGHVFLDTMTFQDQRILTQYFQTSFLLNNVWPTEASLVKYFVNTTSGEFKRLVLTNQNSGTFSGYFPTINNKFYGRPEQQYVYIVRNPFSDSNYIWKYNVKNVNDHKIMSWKPSNEIFLSEPTFVQKPNSSVEDDGVLIVGAFNSTSRKGVIFILDASNISNIYAIVEAPALTPFGLKNTFIKMNDNEMKPYCSIAFSVNSFCFLVFGFVLVLFNRHS